MKLGILTAHYGCVNDETLDRVLRGLRFKNLEIVCDADGSDSPVLRWAEKRDLIVRPFTEPMPPETLGFWARRRAMRARCRRFVERCDCVYLIERKGLRTRMIQRCCRRRGISCFVD